MDAMKQAVKDVMEGKGTIREVASRYAVPFSSLGRKVKKMRQAVSGVSVGDTEPVSGDASPVLQENVLLETDNSGTVGSSVSVEPATMEDMTNGNECTEGMSDIVASSISGEDTIEAKHEPEIVSEFAPVGASDDKDAELEKLRAENAKLRADNQVLAMGLDELTKLQDALDKEQAERSASGETYGCGINPSKFKKGDSPACEACQIEIEFFVERVDKIFQKVLYPRLSPEKELEAWKQGLKDWHRLSVEMDLKSEFFEQQDPAVIEQRNKMKGAEQVRLDAIDFKQWLLNVKFKGTDEKTVMETMGHWFKELPPPSDREPAELSMN